MQLLITRASPGEHEALTEIARAAKGHWGYPEAWLELWRTSLTVTPDFITSNLVFVARLGAELAGFYGLAGNGERLVLEHLWVKPAQIGCGLGAALFQHAMEIARLHAAKEVEIESDPNACGFYERMGAVRIGQNEYQIDGVRRVLPLLLCSLA